MTDRSVRFPLGSRVTIDSLADDPYPLFHKLRAAEPVTWAPELGMWLLTRRDDILRVLADWERFTTDSPASTIRDIFGSHMLTTDGDEQIRYKRRFIGPFRGAGVEIPAGETVQCMLGAANRDPAHFPDPDHFDPGRPNARDHLAFGAGRHFCLGASLARIEAEQALARVFGALPGVRLDPERTARPYGHEFRTPAAVWVRWG